MNTPSEPYIWNSPIFSLGQTQISLLDLLIAVFGTILIFVLSERIKKWVVTKLLNRKNIRLGTRQIIGSSTKYILITIGILMITRLLGIELSSLNVIVGTLGVGLGFGLQNATNNFISGLIILFERPIKIGDRVTVANISATRLRSMRNRSSVPTISGNVQSIDARSTTILTNDNISVIVPNSRFIERKVTNWSFNGPTCRFNIPLRVSIKEDPEKLRTLILEALKAEKGVLPTPAPDVLIDSFKNGYLNLVIRIWTTDLTEKPPVLKNKVYSAIAQKFYENKIKVPYAQADIHIRS
jgi:small-conductance mechanosensitive channel